MNFDFNPQSRQEVLQFLLPQLENYFADTKQLSVAADWDVKEVKAYTQRLGLTQGNLPEKALGHILNGLQTYAVHTPHPNYFGLFNPRANFTSILGDLISATYNPQLAAWSHAPFANEIENVVIQGFGNKFGYAQVDGTFCTGGAESNLTAVIAALNHHFPTFNEKGIIGIGQKPIIYCSSESHHSIAKAAKMTGLGTHAVRSIPVNEYLQMDMTKLSLQIHHDRAAGLYPMMIIGTAGTTGAGAIDDLNAIHHMASKEGLWFHVDAAYGGAAIISQKYKSVLSGIEKSDSITLDLHKWFSIPMGASLFLSSHKSILGQSFRIKTKYMPEDGDPNQIVDPYIHSAQWSRRFMGLKIYLPLAIHGWQGYEQMIDYQIAMRALLKMKLEDKGWEIINHSPLPILCFRIKNGDINLTHLVDRINNSGKAWLSIYPVQGEKTCRVCITNYQTGPQELDELVDLLEEYRYFEVANC